MAKEDHAHLLDALDAIDPAKAVAMTQEMCQIILR